MSILHKERTTIIIIIIIMMIIISLYKSTAEQRPLPAYTYITISCLSVPGYSNKTSYLISPSSSLSILPSLTILWLPFMTCSVHVHFYFNYGQDAFTLSLLSNPWCSLPIFPFYTKHYSLHSRFGILNFSTVFCINLASEGGWVGCVQALTDTTQNIQLHVSWFINN